MLSVVDEEVNVAGVVDGREVHGAVVRADEGARVGVNCSGNFQVKYHLNI